MLFSSHIKSVKPVCLNSELQPLSFPGLTTLLPSGNFQENSLSKATWRFLSEVMVLLALLKLLSDKLIRIDFVESQDQFLFKLIKTKRTDFRISIETRISDKPEILDHLSNELYACIFLLANRNPDNRVSLHRVIGLLCERNSYVHDDIYPPKTFVTSILAKYKSFDWVLFKNWGALGSKEILLDEPTTEKLTSELEVFRNTFARTQNPLTVKLARAVKNSVLIHL